MNRILFSLILFCLTINLQAANISWTTGAIGDWDDPAKWVGGVVPGTSDVVTIPNGMVTIPAMVTGLEMVEFSEAKEYSLVKSVSTNRATAELTLYPNPVHNEFNIVAPNKDFKVLEIYDLHGHLLNSISLQEGRNTLSTVALDVPQGVYTLMSTTESGQQITQRMIVTF